MKKRILVLITLVLITVTLLGAAVTSNAEAYSSYTYSVTGFPVASPDAYTPERQVDSNYMGLGASQYGAITDPRDVFVDENEWVYVVDGGTNRVVVLDANYKFRYDFGPYFINDQGVPDGLNGPNGCFVTSEYIYVADTENYRLVVFDHQGNFIKTLNEPRSDVMPEGSVYKPVAVALDTIGNIYVVSSTTYMGVISLSIDGDFQSFVGAQKVNVSPAEIFWRSFQTAAQRAQNASYVSTEYNNITIDKEGFIYVTSSSIDEGLQQAATDNNTPDYSPVKKFNSSGSDIMNRSGFFGPGGEVKPIQSTHADNIPTGASKIVDVALGPEGTWSIIDQKRSKVYTYDEYGRLLHVFGDKGQMLGNIVTASALTYQGNKLLVLDRGALNITVYDRTEYGDILIKAIKDNNDRNYDKSIEDWNDILKRNSNFDAAYLGIGKAKYRDGDWQGAMEDFKTAYDTKDYSSAFQMFRSEWVSKHVWVIPVFLIALFLILKYFGRWVKKTNTEAIMKKGKRSFREEIFFAFHLMTHPFDGFWDLKHEHRGSMRGALFWLVLAVAAFVYQAAGQAYLFKGVESSNPLMQALSVLLPVMLWVSANWCLTTLFDGEGSFKDIFIATCYSLVPLPLLIIPATLLTNIFTLNEAGLVSLIVTIAWVWVGALVFFGSMITHGYSLIGNIVACLGTIVGLAFIMFIILLFTGLISKIVSFIMSIVNEISFRS